MTDEIKKPDVVCSATLLILGDELIPENVTAQLGLKPNQSWQKGEQKSFVRNDGTVRYFESKYEWGGWKCFIPEEQKGLELEEQLVWWCSLLENKESVMRSLEEKDCWLQMDCFITTSETAAFEISADLQNRLASLRLNLTLNFWANTPSVD